MKYTHKTLLVTGGAGFIASTFATQCVEAGDHVVVLDALTYAGHKANISHLLDHERFTFVRGDIRDGSFVLRLLQEHQVDAVYNFAAESHVDNSISGPGIFINTNVNGVYAMLEAARSFYTQLDTSKRDSFRFIQVSTDEVYGSLEDEGYFHEAYPMQPNSPYSASKAAGDHLARAWFHTYGLPTIVTNCTNNYGQRQFPEKLIPVIITKALNGEDLPIYGDGKNIRDWIHVEDHCSGVLLAGEKGTPGETYCFGGHAEKQNLELVDALCTILDDVMPRKDGKCYAEQKTFVEDRAGHDRRYAMDDSKAQNELGYYPEWTFETGMRATVEWYLANTDWVKDVMKGAI